MIDRTPVFTTLPAYRVAVASLPSRMYLAGGGRGAIVVVDGAADWCAAAIAAVEAGASAIVVAEPRTASQRALADIMERCTVPVIVCRSNLRHDVAFLAIEQRAGIQPRVVVADCRSPEGQLPVLVRDAVGWMRELLDAPLSVATASVGGSGGFALLRPAVDGIAGGSLIITITPPQGTLLRVTALGETTTELEFDEPMGSTELATSTSQGRVVAPAWFQACERTALRRALEAVGARDLPNDLSDLVHDQDATREILRSTNLTTSVVL